MQKLKLLWLPLSLLLILIGTYTQGHMLPSVYQSFFYTISLSIKEILLFILPLMVLTFILNSLIKLGRNAFLFIAVLIPMIVLSNCLSTTLAYLFSKIWISHDMFDVISHREYNNLHVLWTLNLPHFLSNDVALMIGFVVSLIFYRSPPVFLKRCCELALKCIQNFLKFFFIPILPLFIFGFCLNMHASGLLSSIIKDYSAVFITIIVIGYGYIVVLYAIATSFKMKQAWNAIKHMCPAALTGFSTMSSAAALPLTLSACVKNSDQPEIIQTTVPVTVNIHLIGDCLTICIFALSLHMSFHQTLPDLTTFAIFTFYFVMAKFAVAAIPGGGILVMLPILEKHFNFTPEMLSIITALYILFDPIVTSINIFGNGSFAMIFSRIYKNLTDKGIDQIPFPTKSSI